MHSGSNAAKRVLVIVLETPDGRAGRKARPDASRRDTHSGDGLRLPMGTNLPSLTAMIVTSLSGARLRLEKSASPVTPVNDVIVKMASLMDFDDRSEALFMAAT